MDPTASPESHYGRDYFDWQSGIGQFSAVADGFKFRDFISPSDRVVDFGCGGRFLLASLPCGARKGVEINPVAREECRRQGIEAHASLDEMPDGWADVAISNHALEHVTQPLDTLQLLMRKLRPGGRAVFVVPCEGYRTRYYENNRDNHLYTWSPINLGNLFRSAGFTVERVERVAHRWPPKPHLVQRLVGWPAFHLLAKATAYLRPGLTQIRIVATRPD